ncbi:adenylyltransferase/cytidyltransferase family protein [Actinomadura sp. NAK00032]|uniref:adenylyltransferase/cytidyltransferase family protein n=1 Tax=Actinomadura sp. NAK00032 TaxID=2742128 RepID=UPI001C37895B|nr:adenylyltransferase/cytidyltransferase family protein [Actinomadura sp. NAK00032]
MHHVVGFSPGVFDLFHVGHLDLLTRAAAQCDRLVVGVLADEAAEELLGARPIVPAIERMEIVSNVRYVADVVPLAGAGLRGVREAVGFHRVFTGTLDAPAAADVERDLDGTGVAVVALDGLAETRSAVLRGALPGAGPRASVA